MNVRSLSNPVSPIESLRSSAPAKDVKMDVSSEDRESNGRREQDEPSKESLNEEEFKLAQEYFKKLTGLNANGLKVEVENSGDLRVFLIKDHENTVVRRIVEWELRALIVEKDKSTGHIFNKAA